MAVVRKDVSVLSVVMFLGLPVIMAFPQGSDLPVSVCQDMLPQSKMGDIGMEGHLQRPQNTIPGTNKQTPYYMTVSNRDFSNGTLEFSVIANQSHGSFYYTGILLQARKVVCASPNLIRVESRPLGTFDVSPFRDGTLLETMDCNGQDSMDAVRHRSPAFKINETAQWTAPDHVMGHIVFRATIVHHGDFHWTEVYSPIMHDGRYTIPPSCGATSTKTNVFTLVGLLLVFIVSKRR